MLAIGNFETRLWVDDFSEIGFLNDDEITLDSHLEWFTAYLKNPYDIIFSIYYDNTYAGQISIYNINVKSKHAEIGRLFLIPNKRGNGIMNIVLKFILDDLRDGGEFNYVYLYSKVASFSAIKLYEKCGFDILAGPTSETYPDLTSQTAVKMVMRL